MSVIWRKVWRDLWHNKFRTALIVLATAVGVFALGFVYGTSGVMRTRMTESHKASRFPHITLYTSRFGREAAETIRREPGVADAEGETLTSIRWKLEGQEDWKDGYVTARDDYQAQRMNLFELVRGEWPDSGTSQSHTSRVLASERLSAKHFDVPIGTTILIEYGRHERKIPIEGVIRHSQVQPPQLGGVASFFASQETMAWLTGEPEGYNRLHVLLESYDEEGANQAAERIQERLENMGLYVGGFSLSDPDVHWMQDQIDAILLVLKVLGGLSVALSAFLIVNMMNALVTQQVWQIGVMKVVGATKGRVIRVYLATALIYGLLCLPLAVIPGAIAAHVLAMFLLDLLNISVGALRPAPLAVGIQLLVGLVVPVVAALIPAIGGARITPHQAIGNYGLGGGFGRSWFDRLIGRIRRLPRPLTLSLRNTFRRKSRIAFTLTTLVLSGLMFIVVMSVGASMSNTIEVLLQDFGFDVLTVLDRTHRVGRLKEVTESVPGVAYAEVWDVRGGTVELDNGEEIQGQLWGIPDNSQMFNPRIVDGRALLSDDGKAILLNSKIAADHGIQVGDEVTLTVNDQEITWIVVGLILNVNNLQRDNFVPLDTLAREIGNAQRGRFVMIATEDHDATTHYQQIKALREVYKANRLKPVFFQSGGELREQTQSQFDIITYLMLAMAVLAAVVGSVGLASTMSINVVERRREIGVMRATGATSVAILGIFVVEGVLVGALSWLLATPFSYPGARIFSKILGEQLFQMPFDFAYSVGGLVLWLIIVTVLSALASLWPALRATQISVRESLAYE
jgi:putative ABC transport system permease protein